TWNEDWIKTGSWDLPTNLPGLIWAIGAVNKDAAGQADALRNLMTLPAWTAVPAALRTQVEEVVNATPAQRSNLGSRVRRWSEQRDWAQWDIDHPYVPVGDKSGAGVSTPHMDDVHATAVAMSLSQGQPVTINQEALSSVLGACKVSGDPINLHNLSISGAGNENLFNSCTMCLPRVQMPVISDTADAQNFAKELAGQGISA